MTNHKSKNSTSKLLEKFGNLKKSERNQPVLNTSEPCKKPSAPPQDFEKPKLTPEPTNELLKAFLNQKKRDHTPNK